MDKSHNKNIGSFLAFTEQWFINHQYILLWLLNNFITRRWFRWCLRIRKQDIGYDKIITQILPNSYTVFNHFIDNKVELTTDFRTHNKYAKRLYYAFYLLWWLMHTWDLIADRLIPEWSFGFSTLTVYPDPNIEIATVDGYVGRDTDSETLSTIRTSAGTSADDNDPNSSGLFTYLNTTLVSNTYNSLYRSITLFDTSSLTSGATISSAVLSIYVTFLYNNFPDSTTLNVAGATPASNTALSTTDYNECQTTSFGNFSVANGTDSSPDAYQDITFNASGISSISKTGVSKYSLQSGFDINNSATWQSNTTFEVDAYAADQTGTSKDPKLVVTYTIASTVVKDIISMGFIPFAR